MQLRPYQQISIHAPVKGATRTAYKIQSILLPHFNPRSREGSDGDQVDRLLD